MSTHDRQSPSNPSALRELENELRGTLSLLEADLEDLEESVHIVEASGDRWGLGDDEVRKRRGFVERVKRDVGGLRARIRGMGKDRKGKGREAEGPYRDAPNMERGEAADEDEQKRWEMEEQQVGCGHLPGRLQAHGRPWYADKTTLWGSFREH